MYLLCNLIETIDFLPSGIVRISRHMQLQKKYVSQSIETLIIVIIDLENIGIETLILNLCQIVMEIWGKHGFPVMASGDENGEYFIMCINCYQYSTNMTKLCKLQNSDVGIVMKSS